MTLEEIAALEALERAAPPRPWYVRHLDDEQAMIAVAISCRSDTGDNESISDVGDELIAASLVQAPPYVIPADSKWHENAALITALRTPFPSFCDWRDQRFDLEH